MARPRKPWFRKSRKTWFVEINGKQHNLGPDKAEADRKYHELMANEPQLTSEHIITILDKFLVWTQAHRSESTYRWYYDFLQSFADTHPDLLIDELKPFHVEEWASQGKGKRGKITAVKRALNWAVKMQHIPYSPVAQMDRPPVGVRTDIVSPEEFQQLLDAIHHKPFRDLVEFSRETGSRPQEVKNIEDRHVDFDNSCFVFHFTEAKGNVIRTVYLTERAIQLLEDNWKDGIIFRNSRGQQWTANAVRARFKRLESKVGKRYCHYLFRHSWITDKLRAGVDSHIVAKLAGHSDTKMLDRVYSKIAADHEFMLKQARTTSNTSTSDDGKIPASSSRSQPE